MESVCTPSVPLIKAPLGATLDLCLVLGMTLNCPAHSPFANSKYNDLYLIQTMTQLQLDENYNADLLDAMADMADEQEQAMRESDPEEWMGYDDKT